MKKLSLFVVIGALVSNVAFAGDYEKGKQKAQICAACHGLDGVSKIPSYPTIKGHTKEQIVTALNEYKAGKRTGPLAPVMQVQAKMLSDEDVQNVAEYYSQQ